MILARNEDFDGQPTEDWKRRSWENYQSWKLIDRSIIHIWGPKTSNINEVLSLYCVCVMRVRWSKRNKTTTWRIRQYAHVWRARAEIISFGHVIPCDWRATTISIRFHNISCACVVNIKQAHVSIVCTLFFARSRILSTTIVGIIALFLYSDCAVFGLRLADGRIPSDSILSWLVLLSTWISRLILLAYRPFHLASIINNFYVTVFPFIVLM
jgi:hypothetical protein